MISLRIETFYDIRISHDLFALHVELSILKKFIQHINNASVSGCIAIGAELEQKCR